MRVFITRTPEREGKIYSVYSEDKSLLWDVDLKFLVSLIQWQLSIITPADTTFVEMSIDCLNYSFATREGIVQGRVREAPFSVFGKSVVEDEHGGLLGYVRQSGLTKMSLLSPEDKTIGTLSSHHDQKLPIILPPGKMHLLYRFVLEIGDGEPVDNRLIYCVICRLVAGENASSSSG